MHLARLHRSLHHARLHGLLLLALLLIPGLAAGAQTRAFVTTTDFSTGGLSAVNLNTRVVSPDVASVHSDTRIRWWNGLIYVLNRFGQDNVQVINPNAGYATVRQFSTGNGSNPADISFVSATRAYVTRYDGTSILIVNPQTGASLGSISLAAFADADGIPEMDRMIRVERWVFVSLQRLNRNAGFSPTDTSLVAVIDTQTDTVVDVNPSLPGTQAIVLTGKNPFTDFAWDRSTSRLLIGCAGVFGVADGGIEWIDPVNRTSLGWAATEGALGGDVNDVVWHTGTRSYAIVNDAAFNSALVSWNPSNGTKLATVYAPGGFSLADAALNDRGELYVANNSFLAPGLFVFRAGADTLLAGPLNTGLPPFQIAFDGAPAEVLGVPPMAPAIALTQPAPNPSRGPVAFALQLAAPGPVEVSVLDLAGRRIRVLASGSRAAGPHAFAWDGRDAQGVVVEPGLYWIRAEVGAVRLARRVVIVR